MFLLQDDIGLGAVVGSAVYNVMFVISVCALGAGMVSSIFLTSLGFMHIFQTTVSCRMNAQTHCATATAVLK